MELVRYKTAKFFNFSFWWFKFWRKIWNFCYFVLDYFTGW